MSQTKVITIIIIIIFKLLSLTPLLESNFPGREIFICLVHLDTLALRRISDYSMHLLNIYQIIDGYHNTDSYQG